MTDIRAMKKLREILGVQNEEVKTKHETQNQTPERISVLSTMDLSPEAKSEGWTKIE